MNDQFIQGLRVDWSKIDRHSYLRDIQAIKGLEELFFSRPITIFMGENGSGKSTLLEAIAIASGFNPEGGTKNYSFSTYDSHSELHNALRITRNYRREEWGYFLRAESFYNVATQEKNYSEIGGQSEHLHERSHGESFLTIAQKHLKPNGLYFLDEPEAALSPQMQLTLLIEINECAKYGAQFVIATHSPILSGIPDAEIMSFDSGRIHSCSYEDTGSYQIMKLFVNNRDQLLKRLMLDK